jgi:hypothetical protein
VLVFALLSLALVHARPAAASPPAPRLEDVLAEGGRYVSRLEEDLAVLVADETYAQSLFLGGGGSARDRRSLASDVAWVPTGDPMVWAFFRDVREVDGRSVRDREARLEQLFPSGPTPAGRERAQQILEESSRYNLGTRRTVNSPTVALTFLHPRNQARFAFRMLGPEKKEGVATWKLRFEERSRPTLIRTFRGDDVPSRGLMWIDTARGALVASGLELRPPGLDPVSIETLYALDERIGFWLPTRMRENCGSRWVTPGRLEAVARYSAWRRAQVEVQIILPGR